MNKDEQIKQRLQELVNAFLNGQEFAIHGNLSYGGCLVLPKEFFQIPEYNGLIYEIDFFDLHFGDNSTSAFQKIIQKSQTTQKNILVLDNHLIYEVTPKMSLNDVLKKRELIEGKQNDFINSQQETQKSIRDKIDEQNQKLTIVDQELWDKLMEENRLAPTMDFVPKNFSTDSENRLKKLNLYARILEGAKEKNGQITPATVDYADDIADLSIDLQKMTRNDPTTPKVRYEGLRFWADVVLARTWKYGDELLTAEGFNADEIRAIKTYPKLPTRYTYWEMFSHPYMRDLRVTTFWRGETPPEKITQKNKKFVCKIEHQKE